MREIFLYILASLFFWIALLFITAIFICGSRVARLWLRQNYWKVMLIIGLVIGAFATCFYLFEIVKAVSHIVGRLGEAATNTEIPTRDLRDLATATALLLGALAAAATLIFQLVRVWINERTTTAAEEGHITDRINKAVEGLGAEKTVQYQKRNSSSLGSSGSETVSETRPNLEVRIGAILALERIAQDSPRDHISIMEILCAYIRENAPASEAKSSPAPDAKAQDTINWLNTLPPPRIDIQMALSVIARRRPDQLLLEVQAKSYGERGYRLNLNNTNLQMVSIDAANLNRAILKGAQLQGAFLRKAQLKDAFLMKAQLQTAYLPNAQLQESSLQETQFQHADLWGAQFQGAQLSGVLFDGANLGGADLQNAIFNAEPSKIIAELAKTFGDGSTALPKDLRAGQPPLEHWPEDKLSEDDSWFEWTSGPWKSRIV